ncbi:MAG: AraC family transcriptional regulator [Candidatus Kapabacteria bacterium]|jgi:YesN/AraC family two-component response regulator|nr:AraC family transcriptional regulator [Candidatus Kapabacteria bacterium]
MKIYIKNMVCHRCILAVINILDECGIAYNSVIHGVADIKDNLSDSQLHNLSERLNLIGFSLINDRRSRIIESIKSLIIELIHDSKEPIKVNLSEFLSSKLNYEYNYISQLFSEIEGRTIEKYYIAQRIEKAKELIVYDELTLSEIAYQLGYSSTAYLSNQFKKVTGLTPSHFKSVKSNKRLPLDKL